MNYLNTGDEFYIYIYSSSPLNSSFQSHCNCCPLPRSGRYPATMNFITNAVLAALALTSGSIAAVSLTFSSSRKSAYGSHERHLTGRDAQSHETLSNHRMFYMVDVEIGTPPQNISLDIDTGSSDTWVRWVNNPLCKSGPRACVTPFDPEKSSSYKAIKPNEFSIQYADGSASKGDYFTDNLVIGDDTITALQMGLGKDTGRNTGEFGIMGIGYSIAVSSNYDYPDTPEVEGFAYPNIVDAMTDQGIIKIPAYSLYLNDLEASSGTLLFGAMDTDKYLGNLFQLPVTPKKLNNGTAVYSKLSISWTGFAFGDLTTQTSALLTHSNFAETVLLDSGTSLTYIPREVYNIIFSALNGHHEPLEGDFFDCSWVSKYPGGTFDFGFGNNSMIRVPLREMFFPAATSLAVSQRIPFSNACALGIVAQEEIALSYYFGDTFLRSAYVIYDLKNNLIGMGQTNFNSTTSKIVEFEASQTAIPMISGAAIPPTMGASTMNSGKKTRTKKSQMTASFDSVVKCTKESILSPPDLNTIPPIGPLEIPCQASRISCTMNVSCPVGSDAPSATTLALTWLILLVVAFIIALLC